MYHRIQIIGYLGGEPELRYTPKGVEVGTASVAASYYYQGEKKTIWFKVTAFGKQAENMKKYLGKGSLVHVEGRLKPNEYGTPNIWKTAKGEPRADYEVTAYEITYLDKGGSAQGFAETDEPDEPVSIPF